MTEAAIDADIADVECPESTFGRPAVATNVLGGRGESPVAAVVAGRCRSS